MTARLLIMLALAAVLTTGCTTLRAPTRTPDSFPSAGFEAAYQVSNAFDFATTVNTARRPDCYHEAGFPTEQIIGRHPSSSSVEAYWAVSSAVHYTVSRWLDREVDATDSDVWRAARWTWHVLTIAASVKADVNNYRIGLRPFGTGATCVEAR